MVDELPLRDRNVFQAFVNYLIGENNVTQKALHRTHQHAKVCRVVINQEKSLPREGRLQSARTVNASYGITISITRRVVVSTVHNHAHYATLSDKVVLQPASDGNWLILTRRMG